MNIWTDQIPASDDKVDSVTTLGFQWIYEKIKPLGYIKMVGICKYIVAIKRSTQPRVIANFVLCIPFSIMWSSVLFLICCRKPSLPECITVIREVALRFQSGCYINGGLGTILKATYSRLLSYQYKYRTVNRDNFIHIAMFCTWISAFACWFLYLHCLSFPNTRWDR